MSRKIVCPECGELKPMHLEDVARGFKRRRIWIKLLFPMICDMCGQHMAADFMALAETMWNHSREGPPETWEDVYGKPQP